MRYLGQLALVLASAVIVIMVWSGTSYRGPGNILPMLFPPVVIGWSGNQGWDRHTVMILALSIVHFAAIAILGVLVIGY